MSCKTKSHSAADGLSEVGETGHGGFGSRTSIEPRGSVHRRLTITTITDASDSGATCERCRQDQTLVLYHHLGPPCISDSPLCLFPQDGHVHQCLHVPRSSYTQAGVCTRACRIANQTGSRGSGKHLDGCFRVHVMSEPLSAVRSSPVDAQVRCLVVSE